MNESSESDFFGPGEIRTVNFKDFNPQEALKFPPGWKITPFEIGPDKYSGWKFTVRLKNRKKANIRVDPNRNFVSFCMQEPASSNMELEGVRQVEFKPKIKEVTFKGKDGSYAVRSSFYMDFGNFTTHYLYSNNGKLRCTLSVIG